MNELYVSGKYLASHPTWHTEDSAWKAQQVASMLRKHELTPRSVGEIGCGAGAILYELSQHLSGSQLVGYDISPQAIDMARHYEDERLRYFEQDLLALDNDDSFDLLLCMDVFEHVPDYLGFLESCRKKADSFIFHIPLEIHVSSVIRNSVTQGRKSLGHLHYFTDSSAIAALEDCGYHIRDCCYTESAISLFWKHPSLRRAVANVPRFLVSRFSVPLSARLFGGYSLLVFCD
jgi:SAM-dependent methyltransferase